MLPMPTLTDVNNALVEMCPDHHSETTVFVFSEKGGVNFERVIEDFSAIDVKAKSGKICMQLSFDRLG